MFQLFSYKNISTLNIVFVILYLRICKKEVLIYIEHDVVVGFFYRNSTHGFTDLSS